ncbi:helix-turn-helix domain-containing protein [Rhodobacterales bacterium HKCCE2091]|nr:helix-turn-helix domain-containing protein [Rhodobacterales bacterium HKCCE2091]
MKQIRIGARIHVSETHVPDRGGIGLYTVLRAGWMDCVGKDGIERTSCPGDDILYCLSGRGTIRIGGTTHVVGPGELAWLPGAGPHGHRADASDPWSLMWARIEAPDLAGLRRRIFLRGRPVMQVATGDRLVDWFHALFEIMRLRPADLDLRLNAKVATLLPLLAEQRATGPARMSPALGRLRAALAAHPERRWTSEDMEAVSRVSGSQLRRLFRQQLGTTPRAFLRRERLNMAQRMMLETTLPLGDIAQSCGFFDAYHLSRDFRAVTGRTPSAWRRAELGTILALPPQD